jgi:hypothetical protein
MRRRPVHGCHLVASPWVRGVKVTFDPVPAAGRLPAPGRWGYARRGVERGTASCGLRARQEAPGAPSLPGRARWCEPGDRRRRRGALPGHPRARSPVPGPLPGTGSPSGHRPVVSWPLHCGRAAAPAPTARDDDGDTRCHPRAGRHDPGLHPGRHCPRARRLRSDIPPRDDTVRPPPLPGHPAYRPDPRRERGPGSGVCVQRNRRSPPRGVMSPPLRTACRRPSAHSHHRHRYPSVPPPPVGRPTWAPQRTAETPHRTPPPARWSPSR